MAEDDLCQAAATLSQHLKAKGDVNCAANYAAVSVFEEEIVHE